MQKKLKFFLFFQSLSFINIIEINEWSKNDSENVTWISIFTEIQTKNRCSNRIIFNINLVEILSRSQKYLNEDLQDIFPVESEMHPIRFFLLIIKKSGMIFFDDSQGSRKDFNCKSFEDLKKYLISKRFLLKVLERNFMKIFWRYP